MLAVFTLAEASALFKRNSESAQWRPFRMFVLHAGLQTFRVLSTIIQLGAKLSFGSSPNADTIQRLSI